MSVLELMLDRLPGENYHNVLKRIHQELKPKRYLEIGVAKGYSLAHAQPETYAIGVDPEPQIEAQILSWTRIYKQKSSDFFATYTGKPFDLIFIDGLHTYDAVVKDFIGAERLCHTNSIMLFHDTIPLSASTSQEEPVEGHWTGDVWRIIPTLKEARPDLFIFTIGCPPSGLSIVTGFKDPQGIDKKIVEKYRQKDFAWLEPQWKTMQNVFASDPSVWYPLLDFELHY